MDYPCVLCNRHFGSKGALKQHQSNSPAHKKTTHCKTCDRFFGTKEALKQHEQTSPVHKKTLHCETFNPNPASKKTLNNTREDCHALQKSSKHSPGASSGPQRDKTVLTNTCATYPNPDMPSLIIKRYTRILASVNSATVASLRELLGESIAKPTQETREFFTYPAFHQNIAEAVLPEISSTWFQEDESDENFDNEWFTHVLGIFICNNGACKSQLWVSRKVPIEIRGYDENGYSAFVYNQRCKSCDGLGSFVLDKESYVERVAYRLKKWAGVTMPLPYYRPKEGLPHETDFCEGCKRGMSMASNSSPDYEHDPAAAEEPTLEEVFSIESLIYRVEEMQRRDQLDTLHKLTPENSLLHQLILDYQQHWCWTIYLLETAHEAARSLQKALGHCFK
ncbi:hypothetical protein BS50DRAFT_682369 [Corynespora cassiicola Philippines]|uniref:C2H2-type domain-containing protein n=1 Tax=Corynespora cassiicola Philippines TaxID=1448308 RepID=A0A2T2N1F9_CORCC|nr:hypothetical protein BS50DRAFT_682369 [Corynespora cassiicola Philippines]